MLCRLDSDSYWWISPSTSLFFPKIHLLLKQIATNIEFFAYKFDYFVFVSRLEILSKLYSNSACYQ